MSDLKNKLSFSIFNILNDAETMKDNKKISIKKEKEREEETDEEEEIEIGTNENDEEESDDSHDYENNNHQDSSANYLNMFNASLASGSILSNMNFLNAYRDLLFTGGQPASIDDNTNPLSSLMLHPQNPVYNSVFSSWLSNQNGGSALDSNNNQPSSLSSNSSASSSLSSLLHELKLMGQPPHSSCHSPQKRMGHPYQNRNPPKRKKPRTSFNRPQIVELEKRFLKQKYLASSERTLLAKLLKMTDAQVKTWFQNRRTKWRRQNAEEKEAERQATQKLLLSLKHQQQSASSSSSNLLDNLAKLANASSDKNANNSSNESLLQQSDNDSNNTPLNKLVLMDLALKKDKLIIKSGSNSNSRQDN